MRSLTTIILCLFSITALACKGTLLDHNFKKLASDEEVNLCETYSGKVILVVNTASKCGYTYQYDGLEKLNKEYGNEGLGVLGFPSNDFMGQEPGTEEEIHDFCRLTYSVKFPMFEKTTVKKNNAHPFYHALADSAGSYPQWNFHKYLIGRDGDLITDFRSGTKPYDNEIIGALEKALQENT